MTNNSSDSVAAAKKVKYTASIIYLLVFAFIVGGSYINQQPTTAEDIDEIELIKDFPK
jgi:hypothetical protein